MWWRPAVGVAFGLAAAAALAGPGEPVGVPPREVPAAGRDPALPVGAVRTFGDTRFRHPGGILGSTLSPDGKRLATAARHSVMAWDAATGRPLWRAEAGYSGPFASQPLAFSPDGRLLAVVRPTALFVLDAATGRLVHRVHDPAATDPWLHQSFAKYVAFAPDGRHLGVGRTGSPLAKGPPATEFYDTRTWAVARSDYRPPPAFVSPVGPTAVHLDPDGSVVFSDPATGRAATRIQAPAAVTRVALSPDGKALAAVRGDGAVEVRRVPGGDEVGLLPGPAPGRASLPARCAFTPDGKTLLVTRPTGIARLDLATGKELAPIPDGYDGRFGDPPGVHVLPDGITLLVCGGDGVVRRWSLATGKPDPPADGYGRWSSAAVSPDGRRLAVRGPGGRVDVWDLATGERALVIREPAKTATALAFAPDGQTLAVGRTTGEVEVRDLPTGRVRATYQTTSRRAAGQRFVSAVLFAPGGQTLLATSHYGRLEAWDLAAGRLMWTGPDAEASAVGPDGTTLVCALSGPNLVVLDPATGVVRRQVKLAGKVSDRMGGEVPSLAYSPDGRRLFVATRDGHVRVCDPVTAEERASFVTSEPRPTGFGTQQTGAEAMAVSPDGRWLLTGGEDRTVRVWEVATRAEVRRLLAHDGEVKAVGWGPGGRTVVSAGEDGAVYQWDPRPAEPAKAGPGSWDDLGAADAAVAYRAVWALAADPAAAARLLRAKVPPAAAVPAERLARLVARLDAPRFADREAASRALAELGRLPGPALRGALGNGPSAETKERIERLLAAQEGDPAGEDLRRARAVQALELSGGAEARALLQEWASGAAGARLTEDAVAALTRLGRE